MSKKASTVNDLDRIGPVVILVVALHAALFAAPVRSTRSSDLAAPGTPMQVRMLLQPSAAANPPPSISVAASTLSSEAESRAVPPSLPTSPSIEVKRPLETQVQVVASATSPPTPALAIVLPGIDRDDDYYPRSMLSVPPSAADPVIIAYPAIANDAGYYRSELVLFIDETGRVTRVRVDGDVLPAALEASARDAFTNVRFRAGEVNGQAVKSKIRVEVVFDNRPGDGK
jgi:periplasmic protein TonB